MYPIETCIKEVREQRNEKQSDVAKAIGISVRRLSTLEAEIGCNTTLDTAFRVAKYFDMGIEELFKLKDDKFC